MLPASSVSADRIDLSVPRQPAAHSPLCGGGERLSTEEEAIASGGSRTRRGHRPGGQAGEPGLSVFRVRAGKQLRSDP